MSNVFGGIVRVGVDPETISTVKSEFVKCRVVHQYGYKEGANVWMNLIFYGAQGATAQKIIRKGDQLFVSGRLEFRTYTDKSGVEKYSHDLVVHEFNKINNAQRNDAPSKGETTVAVGVEVDSEIPF